MAFHVQAAATFTRPNDTTAYASGDLVANSVTASSVTVLTFTDTQRLSGGQGAIRRCRIIKSGTSTTNASFRMHVYSIASITAANGDNGAWSTDKAANYLGAFDVTVDKAFTDGATGHGAPTVGTEINYHSNSGSIYGLLEARAAYTPAAQETFTVALEVIQPDY